MNVDVCLDVCMYRMYVSYISYVSNGFVAYEYDECDRFSGRLPTNSSAVWRQDYSDKINGMSHKCPIKLLQYKIAIDAAKLFNVY